MRQWSSSRSVTGVHVEAVPQLNEHDDCKHKTGVDVLDVLAPGVMSLPITLKITGS